MVESKEQGQAREAREARMLELRAELAEGVDRPDEEQRLAQRLRELGGSDTSFDPNKFEKLPSSLGAQTRAVFLTLGVASVTGLATLIGSSLGLSQHLAVLCALPIGVAGGFIFALGLVLSPATRAEEHRRRLIERINAVASVDREEAFEILLRLDDDHELAELARTVHDALAEAHADRLEAARLRREMTDRVKRESHKNTVLLSRMTLTDELTGLLNRRGFEQTLNEMVENARRDNTEASLIALDMDHFKQLNDTLGHEKGDVALAALGEVIAGAIREKDFGARVGGDEMFVGLPGANQEVAERVAQRIMSLYAAHPAAMSIGAAWPTLSAGIASLNQDRAGSADDLKRIADEALYASKHAGRGRVTIGKLTPPSETQG